MLIGKVFDSVDKLSDGDDGWIAGIVVDAALAFFEGLRGDEGDDSDALDSAMEDWLKEREVDWCHLWAQCGMGLFHGGVPLCGHIVTTFREDFEQC